MAGIVASKGRRARERELKDAKETDKEGEREMNLVRRAQMLSKTQVQ